ncbi:MAG: hypothetical protein DMD41_11065 [Gemmatimonadetes bacterium]|nr:MAG: hypothetical protein AUH46_02615 [Gemmatimonadetes bacterium 13_1_40CM_70_15]PYP71847.1 MAG: hypothetical protein DMD41_11065 [Gemmatimonadota bacterium]
MKRTVFLALATALLAGCEKPTAPASRERPDALLTAPATTTTFSGRATVLQATVPGVVSIDLGDTGPLPEGGGALDGSLVTLAVSKDQTMGILEASAVVVHSATIGQGNSSSAEASVASVSLTVAGTPIQADLLRSQAQATCDGTGSASASGSSELVGLVVDGQAIDASGQPNQEVDLPGLRVVINEQTGAARGNQADITVNALHVTAFNPTSGATLADVVISSAHADITCGACTPPVGDFVTGGGWITGTPSGARANFGVAGGIKNDGLWGHLTYIDHGSGMKVKGTAVTGYKVTGPTSREITGTAEVNGVDGVGYTVDVTDNGEPGREDTFSISLSNGYGASGKLAGGNIKLHAKPGPCP